MSLRELRDALPPYAADLRANLAALDDDRALSTQERWGCLLACAVAAGEPTLLRRVAEAAAEPLGERGTEAAKAAAALTSMNDIYYGALGGLKNGEYATLPAGLSMERLAHPGADSEAFDLWCLAVSALDRCGPCMDAQEQELRRRGAPPARMQAAIRIAAVTGAVARVLAAEAALGSDHPKKETDMNDPKPAPDAAAPPSDGPDTAPPPPAATPAHPAGTADPAVADAPHPAPAPGDVAPG